MSGEIIQPESQMPNEIQLGRANEIVSLQAAIQRLDATQSKMLELLNGMYEVSRREYSQGSLTRIKDIEMSFSSMVMFMIKWAIAAIPAGIILLIIGAVFWFLMTIVFGGLLAEFSTMFR